MMSETASEAIVIKRLEDVHIIEFIVTGLTDQAAIQAVGNEIEQLVDKLGQPKIVIDFGGLLNVSSAMLGVLISVNKKVQTLKGEMRLSGVPKPIMEVFKLTRLDKILKIYDTTDQATTRF